MTTQTAAKVAENMLKLNQAEKSFEVNFTDVETCQFMTEAFRQLGCTAEIIDDAWCLVRVTLPESLAS